MAEIFYFNVYDDRSIRFPVLEPILQEDKDVATWRFRIPKVLNDIDMTGWAWWFVYVNAAGNKFTESLTLTNDEDDPDNYSTADYSVDYGISYYPGKFTYALEAINVSGTDIANEWHTKTYTHTVERTLQGNQAQFAETESDVISALIQEVQTRVRQLVGGAVPTPVSSTSAMTDTTTIYLNTTDGYWYYYNGSAWTSGGVYASGLTVDDEPTENSTNLITSGAVYDLKEDLEQSTNTIKNNLFDYTERTVASATAQGWRLKEANGLCESNANYKLVKYQVVENTLIKVVSDDKFQFQTDATVPSGGTNSNLVGVTYSAGEYVLKVPTTATYLIVSTPTISASSVYAVNSRIETVEESYEFGGNNLFNPSYLETIALWEREGDEYIGTPKMLNDVFASASYPITFEAGKQYAITMEAYHEGDPASGSFGLVFAFLYSDGTNSGNAGCAFENNRTSWVRKTAISDPTKDVVGIIVLRKSNVNWIWHIRNAMVIEGSDPFQFFPYATAKDAFLRADPHIDFSVINPGGKGGSVGSAILVRFPSGKRMLMDTHVTGYGVYNGADGGFTTQLQARSLTSKVRIDYLIISHYHADHAGGLIDWIDNGYLTNGKIDIYGATVFLPPEITVSNLSGISGDDPATLVERQTKIITALTEQNCTIIRPTEGQTINIGEAVIRFVNCDHSVYYPNGSYQTNNYNDFSLCNYIEYGSQTFFCTADIGYIAETYLATLPNSLLKSTFMTAPHHGWQADGDGILGANKLIPDFINRVCPDVVISQNGATHAPDSGNPPSMINSSSAVQTWCERNGISNYATCLNGTIDFAMYKHGWKFAGSYIRYIRNGKNWSYSDNSEHIES